MTPVMVRDFLVSISDFREESEEFFISYFEYLKKTEMIENVKDNFKMANTIPLWCIEINLEEPINLILWKKY